MSAPILSVSNLSKAYRDYGSLTRRIGSWIGLGTKPKTEFWALNDVSFNVATGESIAVLGANGAGKSTLLKLITGTSRPTQGTINVNGHVSAVLELGLGFTPDLTGRENIQFAMGMLGHAPETIAELTPQVIAFAELGHFIDLPLRTYSSGMQARLAFSVATATRPDILIIDEVLSVGDSYFQHKSFARVREFRDQGTSVLVVTHSIGDARSLCSRAIILAEGKLLQDGPIDAVADMYNALMAQKTKADLTIEQFRDDQGWSVSRSGDYRVTMDSLDVRDTTTGETANTLRVGQSCEIVAVAKAQTDVPQLVIGLMIKDRQGHTVWGSNTWHTSQVEMDIKAGESVTYRFQFTCNFGPGSYSISPALVSTDTHMVDNYEWIDNFVVFDVVNADKPIFIGSSYLDMSIAVERAG